MTNDPNELSKNVYKVANQVNKTTEMLLNTVAEQNEQAQYFLTAADKRYLEYFWNPRRQELRENLPISIIAFLEAETLHHGIREVIESRVRADLWGLAGKRYLSIELDNARLTSRGVSFLKDRHPRLIVLWARFLEATPKPVSLGVSLIGFVASVLGIIEFFRH